MDGVEGGTGSGHSVPSDPVTENNQQEEDDIEIGNHSHEEDEIECGYYKSPGGREFWTPVCEDRYKPYTNQCFASLDQAFQFYKEYGRKCGFDVRSNTTRKDRDGNLSVKYFVCSHAGGVSNNRSVKYADDAERRQKPRRTASRRCHCLAKIIVKYNGPSGYFVISFVEDHNHVLVPEEGRKFLRCSRQLAFGHKNFIFDVGRVNVGAKRAHAVLKEMVGSYDNLSVTSTDFNNFARDVKARIGDHDADMIIDKFKMKSELTANTFFYDFKVDCEGHLTGLFWADAIGRRNYRLFGDALSFDPTFNTNRYCMVFIPFTGVDNHWNNVTFAAALLEKEDYENFKWVLEAFLKAMEHAPKVVITDQCPAISKALQSVWGDIPHRLCMWHIMNKLSAKICPTLASDKKFMDKMKGVVWADHLCVEDFEEGWEAVIEEYKLQGNKWLSDMYRIRTVWIPAYFNDTHMGCLLRTTSRSESSNSFFQHYQRSGSTLVEFFSRYESAIDKQRYGNAANNKDSMLMPISEKFIPLEKDAAKVYTRKLFNKVREEILSGFHHTEISVITNVSGTKVFQIIDRMIRNKAFEVCVRLSDHRVECTCKQFFSKGYLCKHAFAALHHCSVKKIPRDYVMKRWCKNVEQMRGDGDELFDICEATNRVKRQVNEMWFDFQSCIRSVGFNENKVDKMYARVQSMRAEICDPDDVEGLHQKNDDIDVLVGSRPQRSVSIQNPNVSRNKGCGSRIKSGKEIAMECNKEKRRRCSKCQKIAGHNARNCPLDKQ